MGRRLREHQLAIHEILAALLDRLAAWQQEFDASFHWENGWRSAEIREHWASQAGDLAADVRTELGTRAELVVRLWPLTAQE